jgi:hypothetical protein
MAPRRRRRTWRIKKRQPTILRARRIVPASGRSVAFGIHARAPLEEIERIKATLPAAFPRIAQFETRIFRKNHA